MQQVKVNVGRMIDEIADLDAERLKREVRLKEIKDQQAKTFHEIGVVLMKSLNIEHLLRLNDTKSYSHVMEQDGRRYRLSVSVPPPLSANDEDGKEKKKRRGRKPRGQ